MAGSTIAATDELAAAIAKSGLLSAEALASLRAKIRTAAPADAKALARDLVKDGTLTRWQANQLFHGYTTLTVGKYRLLDQLGSGETGRVYLAEHAQMNRRHAIKILSRRQTGRPEVLKRFLAEAQRASSLEHRNLSHVYDVNQDGEKYYLVMEYIEGQNLQKLVETSGPLPVVKAAELVCQAIDGLLHAHDKQVVHGDLKPTNLIVDSSGTLKITDMGQARLVEMPSASTGEETTEAAALATALYRAPELLEGKHAADPQCDVYSLGNVLCFLLTGKAAKDAADAKRLLDATNGVPPQLAELCAKMLASDPGVRPALDAVLAELPRAIGGAGGGSAGGNGAKPAVPPMPKTKKTPVARAIANSAIADSDEPATVVASEDENEPASDNPLAGLSINSQPRSRAGKSSPKGAAVRPAAEPAESVAPAAASTSGRSKSRSAAKAKKSLTPMILVAALGGGVLVLGGIALAVVFGLPGSKASATKSVAAVVSDADKAKKKADEAAAMERDIAAAMAEIGETNPTPAAANATPPAADPAATAKSEPAPAATATAPPATAALPTGPPAADGEKPTEPPPAEPTKPAESVPAPEPAKPAEPAKPVPAPAKAEPAALLEPPQSEPKPEPAKPAAAGASESFKGLPPAISLPKLDPTMTDPPAGALAPFVIGACPPEATAQLKGGEHAMRVGGTKFVLSEGKDEQSLGKWNVVMTGAQAPITIGQFSIQDKQLAFQWTPDGAKHEYSPFLGNCKLVLSVGTDQRELSLREPLKGESLLVDLEKPGATVKWNIDFLPQPKKIVVEVSHLGEAFPAHKFDPAPTMEGLTADTLVWTGADPENALLGIKFESSQTPKFVQVKGTGVLKQAGSAKPLLPRTLKSIEREIDQTRLGLVAQEKVLSQPGGTDAQKKQKSEALKVVKQQQGELDARGEQFNKFQQLVTDLKDKSDVHFRVYYLADDTQVDLVTDQNSPPEKKAQPKDDKQPKK